MVKYARAADAEAAGLPALRVHFKERGSVVIFSEIWRRIEAHSGEVYHQIRGQEFVYSISGNCVIPNRTNRQLPRSDFQKAFEMVPLKNTTAIQSLQGPSYVFAMLMDRRIRGSDW
jgi:hypothetical protein